MNAPAATRAAISNFQRRPRPLLMRCAVGIIAHAVVPPLRWSLDKFGLLERALGSANARQQQRMRKNNPFGSYIPSHHDVIVATYAKSGTNWMMQIAHQLLFHGQSEFDHIHSVVPWPDAPPQLGRYAIPVEDPSVWMASPEQTRVIKTHLDWDLIPYSEDARYIAVIRDPKDVFVSNYFFAKSIAGPAIPPVDTWYRLFVSENFMMGGSWAVNAAGYWAERHRPNVMVLSFKSMKQDLKGTVHKVADFMDVRVSEEVINEVCEKSSFAYMKRIDAKFSTWKMTPWSSEVAMIRRGHQGGSSELLSSSQQRHMDAYFMAELKRLGCDLPYEQFCDVAS